MCCRNEGLHQGCCCSGMPDNYTPRFTTREQKVARFEKYLDNLKEEAKAVEEHINEMKKVK
jgi:hypothetical protein